MIRKSAWPRPKIFNFLQKTGPVEEEEMFRVFNMGIGYVVIVAEDFQVIFGLADGYARLFVETAKMYLLGAVAAGIIFLMVRQKLRVHWLRWAILGAALAIDIVLSARYVIDSVL